MNRRLTPAEKRRLERFQETAADLQARGYRKTELIIDIVRANIYVMIAAVPVFAVILILFFVLNRWRLPHFSISGFLLNFLLLCVVFFVLAAVHELIHGLVWGLFAEHHFKDIEFGFMQEYMTPYCACSVPLTKWKYVIGGVAPLLLLGILPAALGIAYGSLLISLTGGLMILTAGGDVLIVARLIRYKAEGGEVVIFDHPTEPGSVVFERSR